MNAPLTSREGAFVRELRAARATTFTPHRDGVLMGRGGPAVLLTPQQVSAHLFLVERFVRRLPRDVEFDTNNGCWLWSGALTRRGYGIVVYGPSAIRSHRASYIAFHGPIPRGLCVCHRCDTPACVNPSHLFLGTLADNNRDRTKKGRGFSPAGVLNPRARLAPADVLAIRASRDRTCDLARRYGVGWSTISDVRTGKNWGCLS